MPYIIAEPCVGTCDTACVEVCPVDCIHGPYNKEGSGVIAQELEKIAPELVNNDGEYKSVAYGNITGYLIEAIKDLKAEVEDLKKQLKNK